MIETIQDGLDYIRHDMDLLAPDARLSKLSQNGHKLDEKYQRQTYGCIMHGVRLCNEWPLIAWESNLVEGAFD